METSKFDIADYLDSNEMIAEYLNAVLEEGNDAEIVVALGRCCKSNWNDQNSRRNGNEQAKFVQSIVGRSQTAIFNNNESVESCWRTNSHKSIDHIKKTNAQKVA